ncbi:MAG: hypothetical protein ACREYF_01935 [Gammaproteobacteria bacterium]
MPDQKPASTIKPPIAVGARDLAVAVIETATNIERETLLRWAKELLAIRETPISTFDKTSRAISITVASGAILPFIKTIGLEVKRIGWDERSLSARIGLFAAAFTVLLLSGEGAGIAALGGAISVPLWVVFGACGAFAGALIEELMRIPGPERKVTTVDSDVVEVQYRDRP